MLFNLLKYEVAYLKQYQGYITGIFNYNFQKCLNSNGAYRTKSAHLSMISFNFNETFMTPTKFPYNNENKISYTTKYVHRD